MQLEGDPIDLEPLMTKGIEPFNAIGDSFGCRGVSPERSLSPVNGARLVTRESVARVPQSPDVHRKKHAHVHGHLVIPLSPH
jgi:hypothetical protein